MSRGLIPGSRLGPYEIVAAIGAGGMGEVLRARDTKLGREVAIKVLPAAFAQDAERVARFRREAQILASLNHTNIAAIHGLEESEGVIALAMELVEGEDLSQRLKRGALPTDEAIAIAKQISEALAEAHEKGIVHRDLKPANVKVTPDGKVKVLDFGLAKAMSPDPMNTSGSHDLSQSPTLATAAGTQAGLILGTAAYMSPEQARGKAVDKRADIWAFGVVLWEMLTGRQLFAGDTVSDILATVLTREPDWAELPPQARRLAKACLQKDPKRRLRDIGDAWALPEELPVDVGADTAKAPGRRFWPWLGGAVAGLLLGALAMSRFGAAVAPPPVGEATLRTLVAGGPSSDPSLAPDGKTLAFTSIRNGEMRVWIKDLVSGSESALGPSPSSKPIFSPDGTSVLFEKEGSLYRIALATREERLVAREARDGDWSPDGRSVVYMRWQPEASDAGAPLRREVAVIDIGSGQQRSLHSGALVGGIGGAFPRWSPDGKRIAIAITEGQAGVPDRLGLLDPGSGQFEQFALPVSRVAVTKVQGMSWVSARRLALLLADGGGYLGASGRIAVFDVVSKQLRSLLPLLPIGSGIAVAGKGSLVVSLGSLEQSLHQVERTGPGRWGNAAPLTEGPFSDRQPAYSPDGRWLLFSSNRSGNLDVWRLSRESGELQRLTDHEAQDWDPASSPDGRRLLFSSNRSGRFQIWMADADGNSPRQVTDFENAQNPTMTGDGQWVLFTRQDSGEDKIGVWKIRPDGTEATLVARTRNAFVPEVSPDGRFVAFNASGGTAGPRPGVLRPDAVAQVLRLADGKALPLSAPTAYRFRWSVEDGRTFLWAIVPTAEDISVRRFAFDPDRGVTGPGEVVVRGSATRMLESLGVARDGSALTYSQTASVRTQIIQVDGLGDLDQ
ncbi:MAG: serine/threonine-protein kinase [Vicinamibacteria bacterium]|nr:serine/threonine-protein kinase [Vicinamibacteria bacterium]